MTCNNVVLKTLGSLRGVFGAEIDSIAGQIVVNHTDEVNRQELAKTLDDLGWKEIEQDLEELKYDDPSIWGCAL
jgi:hypothetical protein